MTDRDAAILWARQILTTDFVVLDTETTGLDHDDVAIQIGIVDRAGAILLDTYVKPWKPIPARATQLHGITDEMVKGAPGFEAVYPRLITKTNARIVLIYNRDFDWRIIKQSLIACGDSWDQVEEAMAALCLETHCAMEWFAQFYGDWNDYHGSYRWQKLTTAAAHFGLSVVGAHGAVADALLTLAIVHKMAETKLGRALKGPLGAEGELTNE